MARDQQSLQIPLRASSAHAQSQDFGDSQEDRCSEKSKNSTSKAQKVLGTNEIPMQRNTSSRDDAGSTKRRKARPSFMKSSLSPFPSSNNADAGTSDKHQQQPQLRVRASSPLLVPGTSQSHDAAPKKTVHHSGSSSALFSYFSSHDSTVDSEIASHGKETRPATASISLNSKGSKDSKRKLRPPRIDLSLLFPKPKPTGAPLLSPQRMVHSPSPLSAVGEFPKGANPETRPPGRRYTAAHSPTQATTTTVTATPGPPPVPPSAVLRPTSHRSAPGDRSSAISTDTNWLEPPLHRTVRTSEMDMALQNYSELQQQQQQQQQQLKQQREQEQQLKQQRERDQQEQQKQQREREKEEQRKRQLEQHEQQQQQQQQQREKHAVERPRPDGTLSMYSRGREQLHSSHSKSPEKTPHRMPSNSSVGGWSKETYLSPKSQPRMPHRRPSLSPDRRPVPPRLRERDCSTDSKSSASKKSNKSTLANSDLTTSSVLCLSSSEDEDDEEMPNDGQGVSAVPRESVTTYGEFEPEICTASAAQATKGRAVKRVDLHRQLSDSMKGGTMLRSPTVHRNPSMSSAGRSSYAGWKAASGRSSGIPTISEPNILSTDHFPVPNGGHPPLSAKEIQRRSRVIAVTRQEENLLEAMRQRKGKVTPSLFNETRYNHSHHPLPTSNPGPKNTHNHNHNHAPGPDPDQGSMLSVPSRDSLNSTDVSFLRLSASIPSRADEGAAHMDKDELPSSQGAASDAEQKTLNSYASPRTSLVYSESLPSPSTSATSPLTPTLPIHRFSTQSAQSRPPSHPPPAVPSHDQRRHSRRRTDSSEAIVLGEETDDTKETEELPIWALGWNHDQNLATVH